MDIKFKRESGISIIEILVSLAIVIPVATAFTNHLLVNKRLQKVANVDHDKEVLKMMVIKSVNCELSPDPVVSCPANGFIALNKTDVNGNAKPFITNTGAGMKYGAWTLRAECNATNDGYLIRATRLSEKGTLNSTNDADFIPNPINKTLKKWGDAASLLFGEGVSLCGGEVGAFPPPNYISAWQTPPATFVHNLDSTKLKIHYQIKSTAPGSNWPLLNQEAFDASGYWVAHRNPKIVIDEITKMTIRARVDDNLQSTVASPNFGPLSSINKVRVMIWKIN